MNVRYVTQHPETLRVLEDARRVGEGEAPVLIVGEAGTGKVVLARLIRECSDRRDAAFVLTGEGDVAGYERELFGAPDHRPRAPEADGGILALDFGRPLPRALQARLLRLIGSGEYRDDSTGDTRQIDVRVMALTNLALDHEAREGRFDPALLACFENSTVSVLPLRDRRADIPLLTDHFLGTQTPEGRPTPALAPETLEALLHHSWPENARGLMEVIVYALEACDGPTILPEHLPGSVRAA